KCLEPGTFLVAPHIRPQIKRAAIRREVGLIFCPVQADCQGFTDAETRASQESIQGSFTRFRTRYDLLNLLTRESGSVLFAKRGQIHESVIPLSRIDRVSFIIHDRRNHDLHEAYNLY